MIERDDEGNAIEPTTAEWRECHYRLHGQCPCRFRCVYEGPEDQPPLPDVPQNK